MNRNSEVPLVVADAFVMFYDNIIGKWVASGASKSVTVAKVQLLHNLTTNQFRIFAWNPINKEVLVSSVLYYNLRYQKAHATFHEWRDADTQLVYGLHFADAKEAHVFGDVISKVFLSLEFIYQQGKELQAVIARGNVPTEQYSNRSSNVKLDSQTNFIGGVTSNQSRLDPKPNDFYSTNLSTNLGQVNQIQRSDCIPISKVTSLNQMNKHSISFDSHELPNYENINNILLKPSEMKSLSIGSENLEFSNNRCQSSSDDSVRGLKRQPSSASSGYATVASMVDQYSPTPGLTSSFSMVAEALNRSISDSKSQVQSYLDNSKEITYEKNLSVEEPVQSSFASQIQNIIQQRKQSQTNDNTKGRSDNTQKSSDATVEIITSARDLKPIGDSKTSNASKIKPVDDIMSEMKIKLQRRKQLIDGHTDPNYSSSTEKSDVCSSNTSDAGSFDEERSVKFFDEMRDVPSNIVNLKKRSTGDIMQLAASSSVLASKDDLDRIKLEITNDFRRELLGIKKEVVDAIRLHQNVSS